MDRSSSSSVPSSLSRQNSASSPFAYQTRLLERTSSTRSNSLSRSGSGSGVGLLSSLNTGSSAPLNQRRWVPSHRPSNSVDAVRGKWEERSREAAVEEAAYTSSSRRGTHGDGLSRAESIIKRSESPSSQGASFPSDSQRAPTYLKRHTLPAPIIASPLSPNSTGIVVENNSPIDSAYSARSSSPPKQQIKLPIVSPIARNLSSENHSERQSRVTPAIQTSSHYPLTTRLEPESLPSSSTEKPKEASPLKRRPLSYSGPSASERSAPVPASFEETKSTLSKQGSVMSPPQYRSSYMMNKKTSTYTSTFGSGRRRLGNHLPRIASGDGDPDWEARLQDKIEAPPVPKPPTLKPPATNGRHMREHRAVPVVSSNDVAGIPGRIRLSRSSVPKATAAVPSAGIPRGLWADTQRHLVQAYEYLCHVGEAQQWIEGCLGEELSFGVVEMEDGLRNGVVLAKLVRSFRGESFVKRIYEAPKLDFRHSDNINIFFSFVREVGLPECFVFELTDLYEKKNIPKVIYCIHALSHLMARRGLAERINNLLGQLQFTDDQLQRTQKGLKDAGVPMPNFGNVGRELAKEINEPEIETDDERRDRLLLENERSIIALQSQVRGYLARKDLEQLQRRIAFADRDIVKIQAQSLGYMIRHRMTLVHRTHRQLNPWVTRIQATARAAIQRRRWLAYLQRIARAKVFTKVQAQARGVLVRRRYLRMKGSLRQLGTIITRMQAVSRGSIARTSHTQTQKLFVHIPIQQGVVSLQAVCRGALSRTRAQRHLSVLSHLGPLFTRLQAHCRGVLSRRQIRRKLSRLEDFSHTIVRIQAAARTFLVRKRLLTVIRGLRRATPAVIDFQAISRAHLARQRHHDLGKTLSGVQVVKSVLSLQAAARTRLARHAVKETNSQLSSVATEILQLQAASRTYLVRRQYIAWRDYLHNSHAAATALQALLRSALQRARYRRKLEYFNANLGKVVKIQALFRAKETREQYRQLTLGKNVTVGTIKNFVHLLDDSESDFQEEIKVERLRKRVVENIRENQTLENEMIELDAKIGRVVENVKSVEEVIKARRKHGADSTGSHRALLAKYGDPFSGHTLDQSSRRKLELYQQLFYLLQTKPEYLSKLFLQMTTDASSEKDKRFLEKAVLVLFGYGQDRREDYLLLKLFQAAIRSEVEGAASLYDIIKGHPLYLNVAVHYVRPKQTSYVRDTFQGLIKDIVAADDLDLEVDPVKIRRSFIEMQEMRSGTPSQKSKEVSFLEATHEPETRAEYIRHLQLLQWWTKEFVKTISQSTRKMPYGIRYLARETLIALRTRFSDASDVLLAACLGRLIYYRYINPAIVTPEPFDIISTTINVAARKNLDQISRVLTQITSGSKFPESSPAYVPINDYVEHAVSLMTSWLLDVADVADAETYYHAHEFLDVTVQPRSIYITPNEIYTMHGLLVKYHDFLISSPDDTLHVILAELDGVPHFGSEELKDARDIPISLELTNRFANLPDPHAEEKTLWVEAKRAVLAVLRVQPANTLRESLLKAVTPEDEQVWEEVVMTDYENERHTHSRRQPSTTAAEAVYRLNDIRELSFSAVKHAALRDLLTLEKQGRVTREDDFRAMLESIAGDVRSKHRRRLQRQQEIENMNEVLRQLAEQKKVFEETIAQFQNYVSGAMDTMQRGRARRSIVLPFTKQYFHQRELHKSGQTPQFGSFIYTAKTLYQKGMLLSVDGYSPKLFDKMQIIISSNSPGVFNVTLESTLYGPTSRIASEDIRMDDLLQGKYEQKSALTLFGGLAKFHFEKFLFQINKKFYA